MVQKIAVYVYGVCVCAINYAPPHIYFETNLMSLLGIRWILLAAK